MDPQLSDASIIQGEIFGNGVGENRISNLQKPNDGPTNLAGDHSAGKPDSTPQMLSGTQVDSSQEIRKTWFELGVFWTRVVAAMLRIPALLLSMASHHGLDRAISWGLAEQHTNDMEQAFVLAKGAVFLIFMCIYLQLAVEMLAVFIPGLRPRTMLFKLGKIKVEIGDGSNSK